MLGFYNRLSTEVYNLDKPIGMSFGDVEYYYSRLEGVSGPILEAGVGTGRILIPLLELGLDVDGLDLSKEMLKVCKDNCKSRGLGPDLFIERMENFKINKSYQAIVVPTGTFQLIYKRETARACLKNFYNHLCINGRLLIYISINDGWGMEDSPTRLWENEEGETIVLDTKPISIDYINQYVTYRNRYEKWKDGRLIDSELESFPLAWYGVDEFRLLLLSIGFRDISISSSYDYGLEPDSSSKIVTFEASK